ncbi:MAG: hypothetical protein LBN00_00700 [Oscillospiraceae bacterium]|nr:hypothetical protein [Oscillospiraceae bacterium]
MAALVTHSIKAVRHKRVNVAHDRVTVSGKALGVQSANDFRNGDGVFLVCFAVE